MTAVAPPLLSSFQPNTHPGWPSDGHGFRAMNSDEISKMFTNPPRKTAQRQNSSSSIASTASSTSTISAPSSNANAAANDTGNWGQRKKPTRWPQGKAEPATGISTARPQAVSSATSGPTASSAISALHTPHLPSQQMVNGNGTANGVVREQVQAMPSAVLHLIPMNGTFERKSITVPYTPDVLRIGRQTNQKTVPTPSNGYFDSKVLSRQHAEIYADRNGRIFIRDVKSSNGTFVNGLRLSQENKESEPRELREQDMLELGIDIVSEDQKTVVHHKVAAKVEHAGIYGQGSDALSFGDLDPSAGAGLLGGPHLKRSGSQGSIGGRSINPAVSQAAMGLGALGQPQALRNYLNPVTTEQMVKRLNNELKLAMQQSQDLQRAKQQIELMLGGKLESPVTKEPKPSSERSKSSPTKAKLEFQAHQFFEPPAPPPQAPLPEKPDVLRALADPIIQPLLRRNDTTRPESSSNSPTRVDHSGDILRLCEELKLAKGELSNQSARMKSLETELAQERTARTTAEERAQRLEQGESKDSTTDDASAITQRELSPTSLARAPRDLQAQVDRLNLTMDEMKQQLEAYRRRAESAEVERDEARETLASMVEQKRKEMVVRPQSSHANTPQSPRSPSKREFGSRASFELNGHTISPIPRSPTSENLMERAGVAEGQPITQEQAKIITDFLTQEVLGTEQSGSERKGEDALVYYGLPYGSMAAVVILGYIAMTWVNGWPPKVER